MTNICFVDDTLNETFSIITCKNSTIYHFPWNSHNQYTVLLIVLFHFMFNPVRRDKDEDKKIQRDDKSLHYLVT